MQTWQFMFDARHEVLLSRACLGKHAWGNVVASVPHKQAGPALHLSAGFPHVNPMLASANDSGLAC